ncbi:thioredoxin-disulfide reductase [Enterobacteriaceae bacterium ET-AT1-13]|nr:thioredoxin-disulfide reductase [Enterobacteriaceae bacterium ET-AT1-13]WGS66416.1 thioredoxin-disulfide reductase [Enterobacteriaceae bacterium Cmel17]WMC17440.1 MAG: thioredoxin-disulfide reductase [Enterobacteriaceae bacterium Cmel21]WMC17647.1 MAG: thioredoxin-disulfide reductase [Enterobacteriaceae bacterium PSmelAO3-2]WMC17851.1 MAG: thioredoxin-disulfide reductase [Enterobacteriaceae bacterium PSmelAO3-1]WMC18055.1 MAG: thioredoxin-disulfide reductase [Enterobacteriaceae bacterium PS
MLNNKHSKLLIIGSGPAGYTASIYGARANLKPLLITGLEQGGQLIKTNTIENWPGDKKKITGQNLMDRMRKHAEKFNTNIIFDFIKSTNFAKKPFILIGEKNIYTCDSLIIATGATAKYLEIPSEKFYKGKGISTCAVCDGFIYKNKKVAVIGGGNNAIEETLYLSNIAEEVHLIHRNEKFKAEKILIDRLKKKIKSKKIFIYTNYIVKEINGNKEIVTNINIENVINKNYIKNILVDGIFIAIGYKPNTNIFDGQLKLKNGFIKVKNEEFNKTQTNISGIFAAGDVMDRVYRQAITSAATGCMAALDAERYLENIF